MWLAGEVGDQPAGDRGGEQGIAGGDHADGLYEFGGGGVLEEEAAGAGAQRRIDVFVQVEGREHQHSWPVGAGGGGTLASFLTEIGIKPVLCATGAKSRLFYGAIEAVTEEILDETPKILDDIDFFDIEETAEKLRPDVLLGSSKGYKLARKWNIPLVRLGFPIHDRFGAQRICQLGYKGTQDLFDTIVNAVIQATQDRSPIGYTYI